MGKKSKLNTFEIYALLREGLLYPSIIYIPKEIVSEYAELKEVEELQRIIEPFDKLWICESLENNYHLKADAKLNILLKKQDILKKNLFELMRYKEGLKPVEFTFLEKSYKDFLYVCMYFSQEMLLIVRESTDKKLTNYLQFFELQDFHYQQHFYALEEVLPTSEEEKKTWVNSENNSSYDIKESAVVGNKHDQEKPKKSKKKKQQYITDKESQKYLLETVFNVKTK